ncbi:MAG: phosphoribosylformylglycinamidine cyclo-ligase [Gemmatimonadaceae bacterium]
MINPLDYRAAGVDLDVADDAKHRLKALVESTRTDGVLGAFGGFGGMFRMPPGMRAPILVSSADGVGTKIKVAIESGRHDTIGHDLVNHCVNDILVQGATPLFFLDYVAFGKLDAAVAEAVVAGVAAGCRENGCALVGGETAEMPGLYTPPDYDLAGFIVGAVEEDAVIGAARVREGDTVVALASSGFHTNGYSLVRSLLFDRLQLAVTDDYPGTRESVADVLLRVHRSYLRALTPVLTRVHALAHITGGGIPGNLDRALPSGLDAVVETKSWKVPDVFETIARVGVTDRQEMFRTFNMGVGMMVLAGPSDVDAVLVAAADEGVEAWVAGEIRAGTGQVVLS